MHIYIYVTQSIYIHNTYVYVYIYTQMIYKNKLEAAEQIIQQRLDVNRKSKNLVVAQSTRLNVRLILGIS